MVYKLYLNKAVEKKKSQIISFLVSKPSIMKCHLFPYPLMRLALWFPFPKRL